VYSFTKRVKCQVSASIRLKTFVALGWLTEGERR
jgi:hypothetical protein